MSLEPLTFLPLSVSRLEFNLPIVLPIQQKRDSTRPGPARTSGICPAGAAWYICPMPTFHKYANDSRG